MSTKKVVFTKSRNYVGIGAKEEGDEATLDETTALQLKAQGFVKYKEETRARKMVEKKAEEKEVTIPMQIVETDDSDDEPIGTD